MAAKHTATIATPFGLRQCFEVRVERDGKPALVARFGGIPLTRHKDAVLTDRVRVQVPYPRKELVIRLRASRCELCGDVGPVLVHQVRRLASLGQPGPGQPARAALMASKRRKPSWSAAPAMTPSTGRLPSPRRRSLESHVPGNWPAWFGGRPRGKGPAHRRGTSPRGPPSCSFYGISKVPAALVAGSMLARPAGVVGRHPGLSRESPPENATPR